MSWKLSFLLTILVIPSENYVLFTDTPGTFTLESPVITEKYHGNTSTSRRIQPFFGFHFKLTMTKVKVEYVETVRKLGGAVKTVELKPFEQITTAPAAAEWKYFAKNLTEVEELREVWDTEDQKVKFKVVWN